MAPTKVKIKVHSSDNQMQEEQKQLLHRPSKMDKYIKNSWMEVVNVNFEVLYIYMILKNLCQR